MNRGLTVVVSLLGAIWVLTTAGICDSVSGQPTNSQQAQQQAQQKADTHVPYIPKNDVEFNNYNNRQKIADDPTTILWCTSAFPIPASPLFTVPVQGKLTSGTKRPYATSQVRGFYESNDTFIPELPGPDGMFGPSDSYRYGFTPGGVYVEFSGSMETYCTTEPTIWQRQSTTIVLSPDQGLLAAQQACQALIANHDPNSASKCQALLVAAVGK